MCKKKVFENTPIRFHEKKLSYFFSQFFFLFLLYGVKGTHLFLRNNVWSLFTIHFWCAAFYTYISKYTWIYISFQSRKPNAKESHSEGIPSSRCTLLFYCLGIHCAEFCLFVKWTIRHFGLIATVTAFPLLNRKVSN